MSKMMTARQAANYVDLSVVTLEKYRKPKHKHLGPSFHYDDRGRVWYAIADLDDWLNAKQHKINKTLSPASAESPDVAEWKDAESERLQREEEERIARIKREAPKVGTLFACKEKDRPDLHHKITELGWSKEGPNLYRVKRFFKKENRWREDIAEIHKDDLEAQAEWTAVYRREYEGWDQPWSEDNPRGYKGEKPWYVIRTERVRAERAEQEREARYAGMTPEQRKARMQEEYDEWVNEWRKIHMPHLAKV